MQMVVSGLEGSIGGNEAAIHDGVSLAVKWCRKCTIERTIKWIHEMRGSGVNQALDGCCE